MQIKERKFSGFEIIIPISTFVSYNFWDGLALRGVSDIIQDAYEALT